MDGGGFGYATDNDTKLEYRRKLGSGGFGTVHEIYDIPGQKSFARKLLHLPSMDERLIRKEVDAIKKLCGIDTHINIIQVLNHGHLSNPIFYFIDMELCDLNLHEYIDAENRSELLPYLSRGDGVKSSLQIWTVMSQIASGVEYIHRQNQVHRDIKPANVLYSCQSSVWKLADFGLSCEGTSKTNRLTQYGRGTPGYRAPELMESDGEPMFNNKVDIWAIGCIIYELATGTRAFKNDWEVFQYRSSGTTMEVVLDDEFDAHSKTSITKLVGDMLQIEPSARPSASVLSTYFFNSIRRLEELSHQPPVQFTSGVSPAPPSTITDETKHIRRSPRKRQRTQDELEVPRKKSRQAPPSLPLYQIVPVQSSGKDVDVKESKDGVNVEARADVNRNTNTLNLALREASVRGDLADVRSLLEKGADVNAEFGDRSNALCSAVSRGHETVAELLLDKGANPDGRARSGKSALHIAAVTGPDHLVRLLLEKGAKVNIQGRDKKTPLHNASTWRKEAIVRLLLEKGADVNALDEYLETPLHGASTAGHEEVVRLLLEKGARIDAAGKFGNTPLDNAAEYGHKKVV